jgi:hypothetical protein
MYRIQSEKRLWINVNFHFNTSNILQDINIMSSSPSFCGMCDSRHISRPSGIVVWFRQGFAKLCCSKHSVQRPSSQSEHQTSDGLEIWRLSHIPQKDGELDMMLISCNILLVLKWKLTFIHSDSRHISRPSEVWCSDCEEGLCTECWEQHSLAKPCRNHTTIPISEYRKLPSCVLEINELCKEHHKKFILYCKEHERPCCRICILENHKDCKEVVIVENIINNVKTSHMFNEHIRY